VVSASAKEAKIKTEAQHGVARYGAAAPPVNANVGMEKMTKADVRTQLIAWLALPVVAVGIAVLLNYFVVCRTGFPLILYLIWGFPRFEQLSHASQRACHFDLATWGILYLHALWLPALFLFLRKNTRSGVAAAAMWGATILACIVSLIWQAIGAT
jgi:hypothetical protein